MLASERNYGLDLARATAICLVLVVHLVSNILRIDVSICWYLPGLGVDIFFALSGFLIGGILIRMCEENDGRFLKKKLFIFLGKRWFRTAPMYVAALFASYFLYKYLLHSIDGFDARYCFWLQNLFHPPPSFFGESWSLCVEEWFYFSFAAGLFIVLFLVRKNGAEFKHKILAFTCIYILIFNVWRLCFSAYNLDEFVVVSMRLDAIAYGVLAAVAYKFYLQIITKNFFAMTLGGILLSLCGICLFLLRSQVGAWYILYYPIIGIGLSACILALAIRGKHLKKKFSGRVIVFLSKISYSIYLVNLGVIYCMNYFFRDENAAGRWLVFAVSFFIIILLSYLTYRCIELPFLKWRDKLLPEKK